MMMNPLRHLLFLTLALPLLTVEAQTAQGLGRNLRALTTTPQGIVAITNDAKVLLSADQWRTVTEVFDFKVAIGTSIEELYTIASRDSRVVVSGDEGLIYTANFATDPSVWTQAAVPAMIGSIRCMASRPDQDTWLAVNQESILRSSGTNAGTWSAVVENFLAEFTAVTWVSGDVWVAVGGGGIWHSENNGNTWTPTVTTGRFTAVATDGTGNVLAVGEMGNLVRSTDSGATFTTLPGNGADYRSVVAISENTWAIGGVERTLLRLDGQGNLDAEPLIAFDEGSYDEALGLVVLDDGTVLIAGVEAVPDPEIDATDDPSNPVEVTLTQSASDTLWYTTDGSDPRNSATRQAYTGPFMVTGSVTVQAVAERDGVYSPVISQAIEAGEALVPFAIEAISISSNTVTLVQDTSTPGYTYAVEYTLNLLPPQDWQRETPDPQPGNNDKLTWDFPLPAGPLRFWRVMIIEDLP